MAVAGAGAIFTGVNTVRALSGTASIISGVRSEFNEDYFANRTIQVLAAGFDKKRERKYQAIQRRQKDDIADYTVENAVKDAADYHAQCTLIAGLQEAAIAIERQNG